MERESARAFRGCCSDVYSAFHMSQAYLHMVLMFFQYFCIKKKERYNYPVELCVAVAISISLCLNRITLYIWQLWSAASCMILQLAVLNGPPDLFLLLFCRTALQMQVIFVVSSALLTTMLSTRDSFMSGFPSLTTPTTHARWSARPEEWLWLWSWHRRFWMGPGATLNPWTCASVACAK